MEDMKFYMTLPQQLKDKVDQEEVIVEKLRGINHWYLPDNVFRRCMNGQYRSRDIRELRKWAD